MKKAPWIGISTACCSVIGAAVLGMIIDEPIAVLMLIVWLICSVLICAGELIGNLVGKRIDRKAAGKLRAKRYGGNAGAGIVCLALLVYMVIKIQIVMSGSHGGFLDFSGLTAFLYVIAIAPPVLIAVIADIISAVIKRKNRTVSGSSPQKRLTWFKLRPFMPPAAGLGVCVVLVVIFRLFVRFDADLQGVMLELTFIASEICFSIIVGMILNRIFGVNFMDNLLIMVARIHSVYGVVRGMEIMSGDTGLNLSYVEREMIIFRVYLAVHIAIMIADIVWYIFKLRRDRGVKPKKPLSVR